MSDAQPSQQSQVVPTHPGDSSVEPSRPPYIGEGSLEDYSTRPSRPTTDSEDGTAEPETAYVIASCLNLPVNRRPNHARRTARREPRHPQHRHPSAVPTNGRRLPARNRPRCRGRKGRRMTPTARISDVRAMRAATPRPGPRPHATPSPHAPRSRARVVTAWCWLSPLPDRGVHFPAREAERQRFPWPAARSPRDLSQFVAQLATESAQTGGARQAGPGIRRLRRDCCGTHRRWSARRRAARSSRAATATWAERTVSWSRQAAHEYGAGSARPPTMSAAGGRRSHGRATVPTTRAGWSWAASWGTQRATTGPDLQREAGAAGWGRGGPCCALWDLDGRSGHTAHRTRAETNTVQRVRSRAVDGPSELAGRSNFGKGRDHHRKTRFCLRAI